MDMSKSVYVQIDDEVIKKYLEERYKKLGIKVMDIEEAIKRGIAKKYLWKAVKEKEETRHGYFIYIPKNVKIKEPIMTCLIVKEKDFEQKVHNIVILDENSEANIVVGCYGAKEGLHLGISEFFLKENAKMNYVMIHAWTDRFNVYPRTGIILEKDSRYLGYYINTKKVKELKMFPKAYLKENSSAELVSIIYSEKSFFDIGGGLNFLGKNSSGKVLTRAVVNKGTVIMRGKIYAKEKSRGHIDCKGLVLRKGHIEAIPELVSKSRDAILTHEAAIGRISEEELIYLMMKGFDEEQAESLIVKGFLSEKIEKMPERVRREVEKVINALTKEKGM